MLNENNFENGAGSELEWFCQVQIGDGRFCINNPDESLAALKKMVQDFPTSRHLKGILFHMGLAYENKGNSEEAIACYARALMCKPGGDLDSRAVKKINVLKNALEKR